MESKKVEFIKPDSNMVTARGWWPRMGVVVEWGDVGKMISSGALICSMVTIINSIVLHT